VRLYHSRPVETFVPMQSFRETHSTFVHGAQP
jgi:hypothetical protein